MNNLVGAAPHQVPANQHLGDVAYREVSELLIVPNTGGTFAGSVGLQSLNGGPVGGLRNILHNGDFSVWQRGVSGSGVMVAHAADRWRLPGAAGQAWSRQADHPLYGAAGYCLEVVHTGGSQWADQRINSALCRHLVGKTVTASVWFKNVAAGPTGGYLNIGHCNTVDDFSAGTTIVNTAAVTAVGVWTKITTTFTMPVGAANGLTFKVITSGSAGSSTVRVAQAQLEVGPYSTPLENRNYALELAMCQRYYCRLTASAINQLFGVGHCNQTTQAAIMVQFPITMRAAPTVFEQSGTVTDYAVTHSNSATVCSGVPTLSASSVSNARLLFNVASGLTAGRGALARAQTTNAYLGFSADL